MVQRTAIFVKKVVEELQGAAHRDYITRHQEVFL